MLIEQTKPTGIISNGGGDSPRCSLELDDGLERPIVSLSAHSIQGKRNHMEDYFDIGYQMKPCDQRRPNEWPYEYFYFGIFDGHGGKEAANFAKQHLLKFITQEKDFWSTNDDDVIRAIQSGFARTHEAMKKIMPTWSRSNRTLPSTAGTTASIIFIKNGKFYTGHVGDSRIVVSQENRETKQWIARQLTEDHKPESKQETERIQRAGGEVRDKIGVHRVVWKRPLLNRLAESKLLCPKMSGYDEFAKKINTYPVAESFVDSYQTIPFLAIARSLGDFWSLNPYSGQYIVSPEPDVSCRPIQPNDTCILLATDGLWNVMNSSYAIRILQELNTLKSRKSGREGNREDHDDYFLIDNFYDVAADSEDYAQSLVYIAYQIWERKKLRSDNITAVVVMLHDVLGAFHRTNKPYATRASLNSSKIPPSVNAIPINDPIQIEETESYMEKIMLPREPKFIVGLPEISAEKWRGSQFLMCPPDFNIIGWLKSLRNYERIESTEYRCITYHQEDGCEIDVVIKEVSDDPADYITLPTRTSKSGKEVRDASAQASQSMHDFGYPWRNLNLEGLFDDGSYEDDSHEDSSDNIWVRAVKGSKWEGSVVVCKGLDIDENGKILKPGLNGDKKEIKADETKGDSQDNDEDDDEDDDDGDDDGDDDDDGDEVARDTDQEKSTPKLRCLMNYSPPPRRTTRSSYQSVSENAKRKFQIDSSPSPKTKRRRSQPIQCAMK